MVAHLNGVQVVVGSNPTGPTRCIYAFQWLLTTFIPERPGISAFVLEDEVVYHTYFHLCARTGRPLGHVPVARPGAGGAQRDGHLVAPLETASGL